MPRFALALCAIVAIAGTALANDDGERLFQQCYACHSVIPGETLYMHVEFTDRYGQTLVRNWPMLPFAEAFADFENNTQLAMM